MQAPKVSKATRSIHKKDLAACKKAALKYWTDDMVEEVVNLEWNPVELERMGKRIGAGKKLTALLVDLHNASKLEFASFAISKMAKR